MDFFGSPCSPRDSQESSPTPQFKSINSLVLSFLYSPALTSIHSHWKRTLLRKGHYWANVPYWGIFVISRVLLSGRIPISVSSKVSLGCAVVPNDFKMSGGFTQLWEVSVRWAEAFPLTVTPWQALPGWQRSGEGWLPWSLASLLVALFFAPPLFCSACRELTPKALFHGFPCQLASSWLCRWETLEGNSWVSEILKGRDYCPPPPRNVSFLHQDL